MSKRYAIYIRVSTKEQANGDGRSPQNQEHRCRAYIHSQCDNLLDEKQAIVYRDIGHSGKTLDRPAFTKMMRAVKRGEIHTIIFTELSRVSRSVMDFLGLVEELNQQEVNFISIKEQYNTSTAVGRLLMTMIMALNAFEREQVSERTRLGILARSERGLWNGPIPLGYRASDNKGYLEVHEEEVNLVKDIYELYDQFGSISKVERHLRENKIYRPDSANRFGEIRPAHPFRDSSIRRILTGPVYLGLKEVNAKNRHLDQQQLSDDQKYKLVEGVWDPIIEEALAQRVRERIEYNRERHGLKSQLVSHDFLLRDHLYCEECGEKLEKECAKGNTYHYYKHPRPHSTCSKKRWRASDVEATVFSQLLKLGEKEGVFQAMVDETVRQRTALAKGLPEKIAKLTQRQEALLLEKNTLMLNLRTKSYQEIPEVMIQESARLELELNELENKLSSLREQQACVNPKITEVRKIFEKVLNTRSALLNTDRYQVFRMLDSIVKAIFLQGDKLKRVILFNTVKSTELFNFMTQNEKRRPDSSYQTALNLPLLDSNQRPTD